MPYRSNRELPEDVRESLPDEAQTTYRNAYNEACGPDDDGTMEDERAAKAAWSAVERDYQWKNDEWVRRDQGQLRSQPEEGQFTGQSGTKSSPQQQTGARQQKQQARSGNMPGTISVPPEKRERQSGPQKDR